MDQQPASPTPDDLEAEADEESLPDGGDGRTGAGFAEGPESSEEQGSHDESNGHSQGRSLAGRLFATGSRGAQRFADASGLDQAIEAAVEEAIVRAVESEATENAIARVINGPLIEQAVSEAMASAEVERAVIDALDSQMAERIWDHVLDGPYTQSLIERIAESPEVRSAIAAQGIGLVGDLGYQVSRVTRIIDFFAERFARKVLLRPRRTEPTSRVGFFTRALALGIDALIINFTLIATGAVLGALASSLGIQTESLSAATFAVGATFWFLLTSFYLFIFWSFSGQTPGMRFLDIRVERKEGHRIGPRPAFRRLGGFWASAAMLGLGFIGTLYRIDRRGLHDRIGGTMVYFIDPADPDAPHDRPELQ